MSCHVALKRIDRLLLGELKPAEWANLKEHLGGCEACVRQYNRAVFTLRQLAGSPLEMAPEELAALGPLVTRPHHEPRRWVRWLLAASALPITVAVLLTVSGTPPPEAGEVQPRGGARSSPGALALRAYCVSEKEPGMRVVASSDRTGALQCATNELLQFAYQLAQGQPRWLHLAGVDAQGRVLRYYPRTSEGPQRLDSTSSEQPLAGSFRLGVRHQPGVVHVVGLLTDAPLSVEEGDAQVARLAGTADLTSAGGEVVRLTLEVIP